MQYKFVRLSFAVGSIIDFQIGVTGAFDRTVSQISFQFQVGICRSLHPYVRVNENFKDSEVA